MVSGVATWAYRLAAALASAAPPRPVALLIHRPPPGVPRLNIPLPPSVSVFSLPDQPRLDDARGDLSPFLPAARAAVAHLSARTPGSPVVFIPTLLGDCAGLAAALLNEGADLRVLGWVHSDIAYEYAVLKHYAPVLAGVVSVSTHIRQQVAQSLPGRAADLATVPYGIPVPPITPGAGNPATTAASEPLQVIYTGRFDHHQKRVLALVHLSDELARHNLDHHLTLVGAGPAEADLRAHLAADPARPARITLHPPADPEQIPALLARADVFVLPSRFEGLCIAMLEAMAAGCVPVVTRVASGSTDAIEHQRNGLLVHYGPADTDQQVGAALARALLTLTPDSLARLGAAAHQTARARFSLEAHAAHAATVIDAAARAPHRAWPAQRSPAYTALPGVIGSGAVPPGADHRLRAVLARLPRTGLIVHGVGRHTLELEAVFREFLPAIAAFSDDDPARWGERLWERPVIDPAHAAAHGTDIVLSSFIHHEALWDRRGIYERQGLRVHRVYELSARCAS